MAEATRPLPYRCNHCNYRAPWIDFNHICPDGWNWRDHITDTVDSGTYPWLYGTPEPHDRPPATPPEGTL